MSDLGRMFIIFGIIMALVGVILLLGARIPWLGRLPGDFTYRGERFTLYLPLATSLLLSVVLSLILYLFRK